MKYRKCMEETKVTEWDSQYLDYKEGKRNIKLFCSSIPKDEGPTEHKNTIGRIRRPHTRAGFKKIPGGNDAANELDEMEQPEAGPGELRKTSIPEYSPGPLLKRLTGLTTAYPPTKPMPSYHDTTKYQAQAEKKFTDWLLAELAKVELFYSGKEDEAYKRFLDLEEQLVIMQNRQPGKAYSLEVAGVSLSLRKRTPDEEFNDIHTRRVEVGGGRADYERQDQRCRGPINRPSDQTVYARLKHACIEYYRRLELLRSYVVVNREGFRKITKKFDKFSGLQMSNRFMFKHVHKSYFGGMQNKLDGLLNEMELLVAKCFYGSDRKKASTRLRTPGNKTAFNGAFLRSGVYLGIASVIGFIAVWDSITRMMDKNLEEEYRIKTAYTLQVWAGISLILLQALLFAVNLRVWAQHRINYAFIFEFDPRHNLNHRQFLEIPAFLTLLFVITVSFSIEDYWKNKLDMVHFPLIYLGLVGAMLFNPMKTWYGKARMYFLTTLWRVFFSGFYHVYFKEVWLGDMITSQAYTFSKTYLFFCLYAKAWKDPGYCSASDKQLWNCIGALPYLWRFVQCIRRYFDSGHWFPHLANAFKYAVAIAFYVTLNLWRTDKSNLIYRNTFIGFAFTNSCYGLIWDSVLDWSLLNAEATHKFLRNELFFKRPSYYYFALIINSILRFTWVLYVVYHKSEFQALLGFSIALGEIFRRFVWCFLRMENEHRGHVESNTAYKDPKLPYRFSKDDESKDSFGTIHEGNAEPLLPGSHPGSHHDEETGMSTGVQRSHTTMHRLGRALSTAHRRDYERQDDREFTWNEQDFPEESEMGDGEDFESPSC